jgi:hypothetical protein
MIVDDRQPLPRRMAGLRLLQIVRDPAMPITCPRTSRSASFCVRHQPRSRPL